MQHHLYLFQHLATTTRKVARACELCCGNNDEMHHLAQQLRTLSPELRGGTKDRAYAVANDATQMGGRVESNGGPGQWWFVQAARRLAFAWAVVLGSGNNDLRDAVDLLDEAKDCLREGNLEISRWKRASKPHR